MEKAAMPLAFAITGATDYTWQEIHILRTSTFSEEERSAPGPLPVVKS